MRLPLEKSRLFVVGERGPEPRLEAWLPYLVAALFLTALVLLLGDVFLGWTEGLVNAAQAQK